MDECLLLKVDMQEIEAWTLGRQEAEQWSAVEDSPSWDMRESPHVTDCEMESLQTRNMCKPRYSKGVHIYPQAVAAFEKGRDPKP